tara:strand:- start:178 stop:756 length:579 start_codon:yes stop_codon:yes gene_type:complete
MFKKGYIEVCLTTEDGVQHLRCHGWLKRQTILIKTEQVFGDVGRKGPDFGMFIVVIPGENLVDLIEMDGDMFNSYEVLSKEDERWSTYKKLKDKDFVQNISNFMFSLIPESKMDIDNFLKESNEATLKMFKTSNEFRGDYVLNDFMTIEEKTTDLNHLIGFFEAQERYEDCNCLLKIKDKILANAEFNKEPK